MGYYLPMATLLTHLLEGDTFSRLDEFARKSADPAAGAIAQIGKNFLISGQAERLRAEQILMDAERVRDEAEQNQRDLQAAIHYELHERPALIVQAIQATSDREAWAERSKNPKRISDFDLDSNEGVELFFKSF